MAQGLKAGEISEPIKTMRVSRDSPAFEQWLKRLFQIKAWFGGDCTKGTP